MVAREGDPAWSLEKAPCEGLEGHDGNPDALVACRKEEDRLLSAKLLGETATAPWRELQRFFAQGVVLWVAPDLDLIEVGLAMSRDQTNHFQIWLANGRVALTTNQQARAWLATDAHLWTLVVRPWILVQEMAAITSRT